jgi:hypothetical protein
VGVEQTRTMHLTNYSVNKAADGYMPAEADPNAGSKRTLTSLLALLSQQVRRAAPSNPSIPPSVHMYLAVALSYKSHIPPLTKPID